MRNQFPSKEHLQACRHTTLFPSPRAKGLPLDGFVQVGVGEAGIFTWSLQPIARE